MPRLALAVAILLAGLALSGCFSENGASHFPVNVQGTAAPGAPLLFDHYLYYGGMFHLAIASSKSITVHTMPYSEAQKMARGEPHSYLTGGSTSQPTTSFAMNTNATPNHWIVGVYCDDDAGCPVSVNGYIMQPGPGASWS